MSNQPKGRSGGVLPINAAVTKKNTTAQKPAQRNQGPRLRLIVRRLPPGLTENEFWDAIGTEWQTSNGKVDWHAFKEGKISKDPSKPSRPARAYLKVKDQSYLELLSAKVKLASFRDAKNTTGDACLVGPPSLEFAPYAKTPSGRNRHDGRQGTIDQDQEFIDFLQSLTEPITKPATNGTDNAESKSDKVLVTPLVQFIKEKKANKAKEKEAAAAAKSSRKNQDSKESKPKGESRPTVVVKSNASSNEKSRNNKSAQETIKAVSKPSAQAQSKSSTNKVESKPAKETTPQSTPQPKPERQRGSASAASRLIARDLGLAPKEPRIPKSSRVVSSATPVATDNVPKPEAAQNSATPTPAKSAVTPKAASSQATVTSTPPTGPKTNKTNQSQQQKASQPNAQRSAKGVSQPSTGAKSAFLKHANPSQGVTEDLLRTTFSAYGDITRCEIDKKKGLGYIDFLNTEALKKAMAESPVKVGNGQVVVLENRSPYHKRHGQSNVAQQQARSATPNSQPPSVAPSNPTSAVTSPQPVAATMATPEPVTTTQSQETTPISKPASAESPKTSNAQTATNNPPTAPKGARGGNQAARGSRSGSNFSPGRGSFNQNQNRSRGGFRGRGGRGGRTGASTAANTAAVTTAATPASAGDTSTQSETKGSSANDQTG